MKLLLFSDLHRDSKMASNIIEKSEDVDIVIGAGDFCTIHRGLQDIIYQLRAITKPTVLVPGNSETLDELRLASKNWENAEVLHGAGTEINNLHFYGIGGGIPVTPFGSWSYDFSEEEAEELLLDCPAKSILVSHSPPKGILDRSSWKKSLGSTTIRNFIDEKNPRLVVCGHIHESAGRQECVRETLVVNAGPKGVIVELT